MDDGQKVLFREAVSLFASAFPPFAYLLQAYGRLENDARLAQIERQLAALRRAIGHEPRAVQEALGAILALTPPLEAGVSLRHARSCLAITRALNERSTNGGVWDPMLSVDDAVGLLTEVP